MVAEYNVDLDEAMIIRAIKINAMDFLYCVWAFQKNYTRIDRENIKQVEDSADEDEMSENEIRLKYKTYTFDYLIKMVLENCFDDKEPRIRAICDWRLKSSENFLKAMLVNRQDAIACNCASFLQRECDE